jgi:hypothetical protein
VGFRCAKKRGGCTCFAHLSCDCSLSQTFIPDEAVALQVYARPSSFEPNLQKSQKHNAETPPINIFAGTNILCTVNEFGKRKRTEKQTAENIPPRIEDHHLIKSRRQRTTMTGNPNKNSANREKMYAIGIHTSTEMTSKFVPPTCDVIRDEIMAGSSGDTKNPVMNAVILFIFFLLLQLHCSPSVNGVITNAWKIATGSAQPIP